MSAPGFTLLTTARNVGRIKPQTWWVNAKGYVEGRIWTAQGQRKVKQHRFVVECAIGRRLHPSEDVHHLNGVKHDNRIENLQLLSHAHHASITNAGRTYTRGKRINLSDEERARRANWMRQVGRKHGGYRGKRVAK